MYSSICISLGLTIALLSCKAPGSEISCTPPSGRFINTTVLGQCPETMPVDIPHFCLELHFTTIESVTVDNGFEKFSLRFLPEDKRCRFTIAGASLFGDMVFILESDSVLHLVDTAWTTLKTNSTFSRIRNEEKSDWRFEHFLNDCLLTGQYSMYKEGKQVPGRVDILSNGQLNGLRPYLGYAICYAGDCLEETDIPSRTVEFLNDQGGKETFVFKRIDEKKSIEFYSIGDLIPDIKGQRPIGPLAFELRQ